MAFNSLSFAIFVTITLVLYYTVPKKTQWVLLLLSSYFFYGYASVKFIPFLLLTTVSTYYGSLLIDKNHKNEKVILGEREYTREEKKNIKSLEKSKRKRILVCTLVLNFGILGFLKYFNFFVDNINFIFKPFLGDSNFGHINLILPLGISFYTFQTMSYIIDVYWKKVEAEKNIFKVGLFVSFFPQMFLGPIGRFSDLARQLFDRRNVDFQKIKYGLQLIAWGFFKKIVIADRVAMVVDQVFSRYGELSGTTVGLGVFLYAIQDYTDFSGGVDIVRGVAQCMGIDMAENFKRPYFSKTIPEFWRRWHMSLGSWMKDYVFYPFALTNRMKKFGKTCKTRFGDNMGKAMPIALGNLLVFFLVGIWHGASWNYILWGVYYGLLIGIGGMLKPMFEGINSKLRINKKSYIFIGWQILRTFWLTCIGCIIFRADGLANTWALFKKSLFIFDIPKNTIAEYWSLKISPYEIVLIPLSIIILLVVDIMQERMLVRGWLEERSFIVRYLIYLIGFLLIVGFGIYGPGFDQNQFVYMQF